MPFFQKNCAHEFKTDLSPVSEADLASHRLLVRALDELRPRLPVISEESADQAMVAPADTYWLVDPLDGTKEFLKGKPQFTVNVALMRQGRPILGVVFAPVLGLMYEAAEGVGAWRQEGAEPRVSLRTRAADLAHLTVVASRDHSGPRVKQMLSKLASPAVTSIGSSLKFCLVAEGRTDLYFRDRPTMEWDTAAAQCVVETAGGRVLDLDGDALPYGKPGLRNTGFVVVGDSRFPWQSLAPGEDNRAAFRAFFTTVYREAAAAD